MHKILALTVVLVSQACLANPLNFVREQKEKGAEEIFFREEVSEETVAAFLAQFALVQSNTVVIHLDTPGGSVFAGFRMGRAIDESKKEVICVVDGMAASMGLFLLQSCDVRVMTTRSLLMGHEPATVVRGKPDAIQQDLNLLKKLNFAMAAHISRRTKLSLQEYLEATKNNDFWMHAGDALALGFVDSIIEAN
jgi:ATP-dependent Clp endopeptidase proteolytic subunit ClpP